MKILHLITGLTTGGAERSLHSLLCGGLAASSESHVVSLTGRGEFGPKITELGVPLHVLDMRSGRPTATSLALLWRIVRKIKPDIVQGWMYHGNLAASFAAAVAPGRPRLVWNIRHSLSDIKAEKRGLSRIIRIGRSLSAKPDTILYNSHVARDQHQNYGYRAEQGQVIPNGFDTRQWRPNLRAREKTRMMLNMKSEDLLVGFVGRYHTMKDIPTFLRAMRLLMNSNQRVHCVMVGQDIGWENPELVSEISMLPTSKIHFLGLRDDIPMLMPAFDLCCQSSLGEAFPNVLGEAMACGVPCVSTDVGDSRYILGDVGRVVPSANPAALSEAMNDLLKLSVEERRQIGALSRSRIEERFSLAATVDQYLSLYKRMMEHR